MDVLFWPPLTIPLTLLLASMAIGACQSMGIGIIKDGLDGGHTRQGFDGFGILTQVGRKHMADGFRIGCRTTVGLGQDGFLDDGVVEKGPRSHCDQ